MEMQYIVNRINEGNSTVVVDGAHFNQFTFPQLPNSSIIFQENCLKKLINHIKNTRNQKKEYGCFLYGKVIANNTIYIEDCGIDFASEKVNVQPTKENVEELKQKVNLYNTKGRQYDCVVHFHTHPNFEGSGYLPKQISDQDLFSYGILQNNFQLSQMGTTYYIGCLMSDSSNGIQMSCVFYDNKNENFYLIKDLFYENKKKEIKPINFNNIDIVESKHWNFKPFYK